MQEFDRVRFRQEYRYDYRMSPPGEKPPVMRGIMLRRSVPVPESTKGVIVDLDERCVCVELDNDIKNDYDDDMVRLITLSIQEAEDCLEVVNAQAQE